MSVSPERAAAILGVSPTSTPSSSINENGVTWTFPGVSLDATQQKLLERLSDHVTGRNAIPESKLATWEATGSADDTLKAEADSEIDDEVTPEYRALSALAQVVMDELNILRALHSLAPRTIAQLKTAIRNKL